MNASRCTATDYINFLVATPRAVSCTKATSAHDAFTWLLHHLEPDPAAI